MRWKRTQIEDNKHNFERFEKATGVPSMPNALAVQKSLHTLERSTSSDTTNRIVLIMSVSMSALSNINLLSFVNFMMSQIYSKLVLRS